MSRPSSAILKILRLIRARELVGRSFTHPPRGTGALDPRKSSRSLAPQAWTADGFQVLTLNPAGSAGRHLIFLPGGAYLLEASPFHRRFAEKLAGEHCLSVSLVDYPKSPEHTFRTTHAVLHKIYHQLRERYPAQDFCLLGDSAGGGLALAFLQSLRDLKATPLPRKTVLISPWLDLSLSHPQIPLYTSRDLILPLQGLKYAAGLYAGGEDLRSPLLSPLFGELAGLGEIRLVFGTEEIFHPDCRALIESIQAAPGTVVEWEEGKNMIHAWPIFPFPGSRAARERIARFLLAM